MIPLFLDTSVVISLLRGDQISALNEIINEVKLGNVYYNGIVLTELISGARSEKYKQQTLKMLSGIKYLSLEFGDYQEAGVLRNRLLSKGLTMSTPDALIAVHVIKNRLKLLTLDSFFLKVPTEYKLQVEIPN